MYYATTVLEGLQNIIKINNVKELWCSFNWRCRDELCTFLMLPMTFIYSVQNCIVSVTISPPFPSSLPLSRGFGTRDWSLMLRCLRLQFEALHLKQFLPYSQHSRKLLLQLSSPVFPSETISWHWTLYSNTFHWYLTSFPNPLLYHIQLPITHSVFQQKFTPCDLPSHSPTLFYRNLRSSGTTSWNTTTLPMEASHGKTTWSRYGKYMFQPSINSNVFLDILVFINPFHTCYFSIAITC